MPFDAIEFGRDVRTQSWGNFQMMPADCQVHISLLSFLVEVAASTVLTTWKKWIYDMQLMMRVLSTNCNDFKKCHAALSGQIQHFFGFKPFRMR
jgi:hypothetical protein